MQRKIRPNSRGVKCSFFGGVAVFGNYPEHIRARKSRETILPVLDTPLLLDSERPRSVESSIFFNFF